ncbi:hypothetical protein DSM104299_00329 [Baekduia alba]|uniref:hypothetical protein n=1 Tax=Baekduia alba TaxID=2997333 RepID=UPI00233FE0E1|nr:hypothetical protein [Baekduia alba]WCB91656.1 hypothetical protein DSM104299_00329 [Baekduia alba]
MVPDADAGHAAVAVWERAAREVAALLGSASFDLRFSLMEGGAAVRGASGASGPVAPRHAEPAPPPAPWMVEARCGAATGWLLAAQAPPDAAAERAAEVLRRATDGRVALLLQQRTRRHAVLFADLLESLTHRLRTDVSTLQLVADGALRDVFGDDERASVARELRELEAESQRRLSGVREVMAALEAAAVARAEPVAAVLADAFAAAGVDLEVQGGEDAGARAVALMPAPGWSACARMLAEALAADPRLGGERAVVAISAHPDGWRVIAGGAGRAQAPVGWTHQELGVLAGAGAVVSAALGDVCAVRTRDDALRVEWTIPAASSS